jgi:tRNA ligase
MSSSLAHPLSKPSDSSLVSELIDLAKKSPKLVKASTYAAPADKSIEVKSWKMNEFKYYDVPSPFPNLARGIFSVELPNSERRIVARGYDKFFNIGEVPWNTVRFRVEWRLLFNEERIVEISQSTH